MILSSFWRRMLATPGGQYPFPATSLPSTDPNTLDEYEEGTFTPAITFETPGDLSVTYGTQAASYVKIGLLVFVKVRLVFTPTFTTASGLFNVTGLPFAGVASTPGSGQPITMSAAFVWPAGVSMVSLRMRNGDTRAVLEGNGTGITGTIFTATNLTSASAHTLLSTLVYEAAV